MVHDFKHAIRTLLKAPGFTTAVIVVLALGIGANTAIFSIVYGEMLKPLPFADASRLVAIESMTGHVRVPHSNRPCRGLAAGRRDSADRAMERGPRRSLPARDRALAGRRHPGARAVGVRDDRGAAGDGVPAEQFGPFGARDAASRAARPRLQAGTDRPA